jgi:hypothetical protein
MSDNSTMPETMIMVVNVEHTFESCPAKSADGCDWAAKMLKDYVECGRRPWADKDIEGVVEVISRGAHRFTFIVRTTLDVGTVEDKFSKLFEDLLPHRSVEVVEIGEDAKVAAKHLREKAKDLREKAELESKSVWLRPSA